MELADFRLNGWKSKESERPDISKTVGCAVCDEAELGSRSDPRGNGVSGEPGAFCTELDRLGIEPVDDASARAAALSSKIVVVRRIGCGGGLALVLGGTCNRCATSRALATCPVVMVFTPSGRMSAHICRALIEPHSMILLFNHNSDTGFVRKSLHPAARAATRSLCSEDAVRATIMTEERYGEFMERVSDVTEDEADRDDFSEGVWPSSVEGEIGGNPAAALDFSRRLISLVAWIPSMTGI